MFLVKVWRDQPVFQYSPRHQFTGARSHRDVMPQIHYYSFVAVLASVPSLIYPPTAISGTKIYLVATRIKAGKRMGAVLPLICLPIFAFPCGWDNDTLSAESKGLPKLLDAIVGRVPIYPKEYYNFRISRSVQIVAKEPYNLNELDNLTVAYDKLGNSKLAFFYSDLKRQALIKHPDKEHEYRYYANRGTIEAHAWLRGKDHANKHLLDRSIANLKKCIEINPDAHFGREIVQVKLIEIIRDAITTPYPITKKSWLNYAEPPDSHLAEWDKFVTKIGASKVQQGLIGIMTLGGDQIPLISSAP